MNYPVPSIDEQFQHLAGCKMFASLDLANGYMQVPLTPEACKKTAFITSDTTGEFNRMTFGLTNAPYEFVRLMNIVLGPLRNKICCCYLDDVIIPAKNWSELIERLTLVLEAFRRASLTLNLRKCEFGKREIRFLGFVVGEDGMKPGIGKLEAISSFPQPTSVQEVLRYLGLTGFFRRFVPKYAIIARPLTELTKKNSDFTFSPECVESFLKLKDSLLSEPVLKLYDPKAYTELHTDACAQGIAGMLMQRDEHDKLKLVYCVSKKTTSAESMYHSSRLELLAIVWTVERLRSFLIGIHFKILTDCQAIVFLNSKKSVNPQVARWFSILQEYDYEIDHRKGVKMAHVDALSRAAVEDACDTEDSVFEKRLSIFLTLNETEQVALIQRSDDKLRRLVDILSTPSRHRTKMETDLVKPYKLHCGILYITRNINGEDRDLYVVPDTMRKSILVKNHDLVGHFSVDRTVSRILERYWFHGLRRYVRRHVAGCMECLLHKVPGGKQAGLLNPIPPPKRPFERIHIDNLGPFVKSSRGYAHIFVIVDAFSRFVSLYPIKTTTTSAVLRGLNDLILRYGIPEMIVCDRGTCFTSANFKKYCAERGIKLIYNSPRHPQGNGMVERVNRTLIPAMQSTLQNREQGWDQILKKLQLDLNTSINKTTRQTPFKLLHGYNPVMDSGTINALIDRSKYENIETLQEKAREDILKEQKKYKTHFDKKRYIGHGYDVGEIVVVKTVAQPTGESTKLQPKYKGPFTVIEKLPSDTYRIEKLICSEGERSQITTAHVSQLKGYYNQNESEDDMDSGTETESNMEEVELEPESTEIQHYETERTPDDDLPRRRIKKPERFADFVFD